MDYTGVRVRFKLQLFHHDFFVTEACPIGPWNLLTPAERLVATRFGSGVSAKSIASTLGLSVHTVRAQLSQVYAKLDIHGKADLARILSEVRER